MAGEEAAEGGSGTWWRRSMDLNLHPPELPSWSHWQHPFLINTAATSSPTMMPSYSAGAAPEGEAPRTGEPEESPAPAYFPWNVLSAPEQHWAGGGSGTQMISTSMLHQPSTQETVAIEAGAPELRLLRAIQISEQHNIVRPRSSNHNQQGSSSTDAHSLQAQAIQHSHYSNSSEQAAARQQMQNPNGGGVSGTGNFECYICFEPARDPVVTSCGHLFCWPCLCPWLIAEPLLSECPVCKGEVTSADITPIYGRGGGEDEGDSTRTAYPNNLPPRPQANRRESLRQRMEMAEDAREMSALMRQMLRNQGIGTDRQRAASMRVQMQDDRIAYHLEGLNIVNAAAAATAELRNRLGLPPHPDNGDNAAHQVVVGLAAPHQQPSSVEQLDEPGPSRRARPSGSPTIRRTRRRPQ